MTWPTTKLKDVALIQMGQSPPGHTYNDQSEGLPFFQGKTDFGAKHPTVRTWCSKPNRIAESGDVLLSVRAPVGPTNVADRRCCIGRGLAAIRSLDSDAVLPDFIRYVFKWVEPELSCRGQGSTFAAINRKDVEGIRFPLPAPSEQRQIVAILEQADALREQRRAAADKANRVLLALFYRLFGDPVVWPDDATEPLGKLVSSQGGGTPSKKTPEYWSGDFPWVSPKDMKRDFIDDAEDHITQLAIDETTSHLVPVNSILVVVRGMILARRVPLAINTVPVAINQDMKALAITDSRVSPLYVFAAMKAMQQKLHANVSTAAHGTRKLDTDRLLSLPILIPDEKKHRDFVDWFGQVRALDQKRATIGPRIDRTFDVLLHRAFTAELTAGWREAHKDQLEAEMQEQLAALEQAKVGKPTRGRKPRSADAADRAGNGRHAGTDMYNKAALVTYIAVKCHNPQRPDSLGRTKLAKLFYLVQRRAEISLTDQFARRAAGPLDDTIHKFLSLAKNQHWLALPKAQGALKPVMPGDDPQPAIDHVKQRWADALAVMDEVLDTMKGWGWRALERWATVENAAQQLAAEGKPVTLAAIKGVIAADPAWRPKLDRPEFADSEIASTLTGLRKHGYLPAGAGANP